MIDDLLDDEGPRHYDRISVNPNVMVGKPVVKGTRIPVYAVLDQLAVELDLDDLFGAYPGLTEEDVRACLRYAADLIDGEDVVPAYTPRTRVAATRGIRLPAADHGCETMARPE